VVKGLLGKKIGMTQVFDETGKVIPVTVVKAGPNVVLQKKEITTDGYTAVQLGFEDKRESLANKPEKGHVKKANTSPKRYIREIRDIDADKYQVGQSLNVDLFNDGEIVDVIGTSKGKGFTGAIKRYNQHRGPMAHGSGYHRGAGSLGSIAPARVFKGMHAAGRMGHERVTIQNLQIVRVDSERNLLLIKGAIPGPNNSFVIVKSAIKQVK